MSRRRFSSIPLSPEALDYIPADAALRVKQHREDAAGAARGWPIRLTDCGEHPGLWGDVERSTIGAVIIAEASR